MEHFKFSKIPFMHTFCNSPEGHRFVLMHQWSWPCMLFSLQIRRGSAFPVQNSPSLHTCIRRISLDPGWDLTDGCKVKQLLFLVILSFNLNSTNQKDSPYRRLWHAKIESQTWHINSEKNNKSMVKYFFFAKTEATVSQILMQSCSF